MSEKDSLKQDRVLPVICIDAPSDKSSETKALKDITSAPIDLEELSAVTDVEGRLQQVEHVLLKLQQPLQCSICLDLLSNPLSTKCGHNFCTLCIHRLLQGVRGPSSCPLCLAPVTKRSLEKKDRISQLVLAVRGIIEGIKKDCGLINSPSKSRALALPAVEDNSDEEEMDEPRRGTRKRVAVPEYSEVGPLLEDGIDSGAGHRGVKKGRNKRGTALIPARNVSAPDVLSLDKTSGIDGRRSSKPVSLKDSSHAMRRSAVDLAVSNPDQLKTLEASSKPTTGAPGPVGGRGRGRGRGGRGRGRTSNAGSTKSLGPSTMSSDEELVSVSQVKETKLALRSADDVNNIQSNQNEIKEVNFLKPKDKVSLWLNESSAIGFKIGLSQAPNSKPPSVMPKTISANVSESQAKLVFKDTPVPKDKAIDVVIPSGDDDENVFALPVFRKCDKEANGKFSDKSGEKLETSSARASSIVYPLDNISKSTAEINKASAFIEDLEEDELPDINCTSKFDEFAESTPRDSNKGRVLEECSLDVSAISANSLIDPKAEELDVLPDSCPVNTKDLFDVLVETARKIPPSSPLEVDTRKDKTTADDVYFFCTPAEGNDVDVASEKANAAKVKVNKKRTLECAREQNDPTKRSKVPVQSLVGKSSSLENISASPAGKKEDLKALKSVTATANKNSKLKMSSASTVGKEKLKSLKSSAASVNLLASVSNGDGETAALVPSCEAMPPPAVPESFAQSFDRKARGTRTGGRGAAVASKSAKTRYASELKKQFCEPPKLVATSLCVKDFKSPGWSHVAGAKKDLKSRHIGLNITGGDIKQDLSRLDRTTEPDKTVGDDPMKRSTGNDLRLVSSSESSVEIDDQTQMVDVRNFDRAPEDLDKISKQKIKVHPMNGENIIESSDSDGKKLLEVTSAKGAPEGAKVQQNEADVQKKKETPLYTTVVPETQSDSAKSVCGSEKLLSADAGACLGNPLPESPLATGSSSKVPFVRLSAHRKPVESKVAAKKSKTKLIPYSSSETSGIHTAIPEVQLTSESSSLETNEIVVSQMAPPASNCIEQEKNNDGFNGKSNVCITETNKVISDGSSDRALKISSSDVSSEDHRGNGPPVRRVMRSGRRRRDIPSSVSSSSVLENISKVRTKPPKTKPNLGSGEEKENVDVEGLPRSPRSLKDMQRRSKSSADLSGNATSYSTVAERAKLRSSLRSANLHVEPVLPAVPKKSTQANGVTVEDSDVAVVDAMVGEVLQENVEESGVELQNLKSSVNDVRDLKTFSRDVEKEGFVDGNPTRVVSSCMLEPGTQVSYTTAYCLTEATKFSSLETSSTSLPSDLPAQSVEIKVGPKNSTTNQVDAANDPIAIPCSGENITKSFRKKFSSEDSQGLEFEERTIIPTVFKNKRMQVDLRTQRRDAATQTSNSGVELASVAVQCELLAERVKHFNVQTEVLGKEVAVQVQLAPESSHVAGVIPFGAVGDSCSDRCIGPLEVLRKTARAQKQCLHAVPCALYQTLLSMLHLVPAQPLTCCGHKAPISETSMADGSSNVEKNSDFKIAPNVLSDPSTGVDKESNCLESSNLLNARNDESSTSENAPIRTAFCSQGIASSKADPVADVDLTSAVEKIATRRQARKKLGLANTIHEEKPLKAQNSKVKKLISLLERNGSAESNFERNAMPTTSQDLKTDDAATDLNLPVCNNETRSSAGNTLSDTLLLDAKQEAKNQQTFKEHLMLNMNHSQTQMSLEIPFLGGVNIQPQVLLKDCTSPARQLSLQQKCLSVISPQHPHNKNDNLVIPSDDSDSFKSTITSRVTRQRSKIAEKPSSQSDIFASYVAQSRAQDAVSDEESSVVSGPSMSKLTAKKRKVMDEAKSSGKLSSSDRKMVSPESDNIGKAKKKNKLKSPQSALGIKPKISESNLCKNIENRKFKRIRSVDDSDSSCDDEPPGKKPALGKNKLTTVVFGVSGHNEASDNMDTYEKNSEELRLEKYDDGVLKYFGYPSEEVLDTALKNTDCTKDSRVENIADLPDINLFSGSVKKKTDEKIENVCDGQHESGDEDDYIPGTADVLKNIAVDAALIQKVRDQNKSQCPGVNASDSMSQETVVLSSSIESCADILQNNILPSSLLLNDVNDATSLPGGKKTKSDGLETKTTNPCLSSATDTPDDVCPSGATDPCLTGTEQQLFLECDRSLRRVERALCSRDSTVSSCGHNTGSDKLPSKATGNSSTTDASDGFVHLLSTGSSVRMKSKDGRSSTSTVSPGVELLDKGDETTEDISHLSILSTQSEVISTQHRNKVQNEVEMLQAKWVALKERLSTLKHGPSHAEEGITLIADGKHAQERSDKSHEVASEKPIRIPGDDLDENKDSGDENVFDHDGIAANIKKSTPHLTAGEINVGAKTNIVKPSSLRSTTQPCASELTSASGLSLIRTTRATVSKLAGQADRKVEVSRACNKAETITSHVPSTNARREADDQDLFSSLPDLNSDFVPDSEEAAKKISTCSVIKRNESKSGSTLESVEKRSVLVCTGLSGVETVSVYKLVKALYRSPDACPDADTPVGELLKSWAPSVTHVIVKCGEDRTTERTLKYLFGVASGCWVIGFEWARRCLQEGRLLNESNFEALDSTGYPGPERGRRLRGQLFRGCVFYCAPPFRDVSRQQLHELVQLCGGQVVEDAALLKTHKAPVSAGEASTKRHQLQLIIVHTEEEEDQSKNLAKDLSERYDRAVVASDWLIECVAMYSLVALSPYLLSPPHEHILKASGISLEILRETQELV